MQISNVSVIGGGTMGNGITHVFAQNGFNVNLIEIDESRLAASLATIDKNLSRMVAKEKITDQDKSDTLSRIKTFTDLESGVSQADLVIEAVNEIFDLKKRIFTTLDAATSEHAIL